MNLFLGREIKLFLSQITACLNGQEPDS
jgi:hypothetical protein